MYRPTNTSFGQKKLPPFDLGIVPPSRTSTNVQRPITPPPSRKPPSQQPPVPPHTQIALPTHVTQTTHTTIIHEPSSHHTTTASNTIMTPPASSVKLDKNRSNRIERALQGMSYEQRDLLVQKIYDKSRNLNDSWHVNIWDQFSTD
jgi:hypothetical protein